MAPRTTRAGVSMSTTYSRSLDIQAHSDPEVKKEADMDVFREPISSDEEEQQLTLASSPSPPRNKMARRPKFSPPKPMISLSTKSVKQAAFPAVPDLDDMFPSSQPKKKRKVDYTARNIHTAKDEVKVKAGVNFVAPAALEVEDETSPKTWFKAPPAMTELIRKRHKRGSREAVFRIPSPDASTTPASTGPKFRMPIALEGPHSSAPSLMDSIFDIPEASQAESRKRSGSTSSLSSHSSIELRMTLEEQQALTYDDTGDGLDGQEWNWCDICKRRVERSLFQDLCAKYKGTGIRRRQRICAAHKKRMAERTWTEKGYPTIDWQQLEADRIPRHLPHLNNILRRKAPSFYRTELDAVEQKGRRKLHDYLKDGVIYVAKQGYYGPRGARVMGHAITTTMENEVAAQLKIDNLVRAAGFGGYVSAVLVPELMIELVKEDMRVTTSEEARKILEQSTEDGALINCDDDEVVLRAEDDD
jgi:hypothetical protein